MDFLWKLSALRTPFLEKVFGIITVLGEEVVVIALLCALFWCVDKELTYRVGFSYFLAGLLVQGMKIGFQIDRPWLLDPAFRPVESALAEATGYSFPSGHTQSATCLFGTLGLHVKRVWLKALCFALVVLVGFSRMFLGVHTPKDVLVSFALCVVIIALVELFFAKFAALPHTDAAVALLFFGFAAALIAYAVSMYNAGGIEIHYVRDCCKAAGAGIGFAAGYYIERRYIRFDPRAAGLPVQFIKYAIGIAVTLALKSGLKLVIGESLAADTFRYFVVVLWILALYPLLIKRYMSGGRKAAANENA